MGVGIALCLRQILWMLKIFLEADILFYFSSNDITNTKRELNTDILVSRRKFFTEFVKKKKAILNRILFCCKSGGCFGFGNHFFPFLLSEFTPGYFQPRHIYFFFFYSNRFALIFYSIRVFERWKTNESYSWLLSIKYSSIFHLKFLISRVYFFQILSDKLCLVSITESFSKTRKMI